MSVSVHLSADEGKKAFYISDGVNNEVYTIFMDNIIHFVSDHLLITKTEGSIELTGQKSFKPSMFRLWLLAWIASEFWLLPNYQFRLTANLLMSVDRKEERG